MASKTGPDESGMTALLQLADADLVHQWWAWLTLLIVVWASPEVAKVLG